jgi:hypothetical protein
VDAYEWLGLKYPNYSVVNGVLTGEKVSAGRGL